MTDLTEQWKKGELKALSELVQMIKQEDNNRSLSDEYLRENGQCTRDIVPVGEWSYGIVMVVVDYVIPYLTKLEKLKDLLEKDRATINDLKQVREALTSNGSTYGFLDTIIRDFERDIQNYEAEVLND